MTFRQSTYLCPGETHSISRSVHLARMAAGNPKCRECPFRREGGALKLDWPQHAARPQPATVQDFFTMEGVRGRYLNDLTRPIAAGIAAAFASWQWDAVFQRPAHAAEAAGQAAGTLRPTIVVGYDQRPGSPDIVAGVTDALRKMSCVVVDIGAVTTPQFWWQAANLQASGGILVTGAGCPPSWSGLEFVAPEGRPISQGLSGHHQPEQQSAESGVLSPGSLPISLEQIADRLRESANRPTRSAGDFRIVRDVSGYAEEIRAVYHALRPLSVVLGAPSALLQKALQQIFAALPCRMLAVPLSIRPRNVASPDDADVLRLAKTVQHSGADVGFLIDEDAQHCAALDETGRLLSPVRLTEWLARQQLLEFPGSLVALEEDVPLYVEDRLLKDGGRVIRTPPARSAVALRMRRSGATFAGGLSGRFWFRVPESRLPVTCDALVTLGYVLKALSRCDFPCSRLLEAFPAPLQGGS